MEKECGIAGVCKLPKPYRLDADKIETLEDVKLILKTFDIVIYEDNPLLADVMHLVKEVD